MLKERGWIDDEAIERLRDEVKDEVEESIDFAEESPPSRRSTSLYEDITVAPYIPQE